MAIRGSFHSDYVVPAALVEHALRVLTDAGFQANLIQSADGRIKPSERPVQAAMHYGTDSPSGDDQRVHMQTAEEALTEAGIPYWRLGHGLTVDGTSPTRPTWQVHLDGVAVPRFFWASSGDEVAEELAAMASRWGIDVQRLSAQPTGPTPEDELLPPPDGD